MIGIDTNLLLYARLGRSPFHEKARAFLNGLAGDAGVVIAELVLVELYIALRNPTIISPALSPADAVVECNFFRRHPRWQVVENAAVMSEVWKRAAAPDFARRRIIDVRLGLTLLAHGVTDFATANVGDFKGVGFRRVWNPLAPENALT